MAISLDEVRHVARLARLDLDEKELQTFQQELTALLDHFEDLNDVDVQDVDPKPHAVARVNVWSDDEPDSILSREQAIANAPLSKAGLFLVPTIIDE